MIDCLRVNTLERKKPNWEKARILHLSTQLEESMFMTQHSLVCSYVYVMRLCCYCCVNLRVWIAST